jgi:hypothetical protein
MLASFAFTHQELTIIDSLKAFQEFEPSVRARAITFNAAGLGGAR